MREVGHTFCVFSSFNFLHYLQRLAKDTIFRNKSSYGDEVTDDDVIVCYCLPCTPYPPAVAARNRAIRDSHGGMMHLCTRICICEGRTEQKSLHIGRPSQKDGC
jgi:hypothetical protein